jgi:hypothetical protein
MMNRRLFLAAALGAAAVPAAPLIIGGHPAHAKRSIPMKRHIVRARVRSFAESKVGQRVGAGECSDLAEAALAYARAKPGRNYVWGSGPVALHYALPGHIVQFRRTRFTSPDGRSWGTSSQHTAIIAAVHGNGRVTLIEQNVNGARTVMKQDYDLSWPHTGSFVIYQPLYT